MNAGTPHFRPMEDLIPTHWTEGITPRGIHFYRTGGTKPALVLLHGFMASGLTWLRAAKVLEQDFDVVMPDLRAHGHSIGPETGYSIELQAEDIADLIGELHLDKPSLLGHSNGAMTAVYVAAMYPALVRGLVLEDPPFGSAVPRPDLSDPTHPYTIWYNQWMAWLQALHTQSHEERVASSMAFWPTGTPLEEEEFVPWVEAQAQFNLDLFQLNTGVYTLPPWREQIPKVVCPILLIVANNAFGGAKDPAPVQSVVTGGKPGQVRVVHFDSGHFVHQEQLDRFVDVVSQFFRGIARG